MGENNSIYSSFLEKSPQNEGDDKDGVDFVNLYRKQNQTENEETVFTMITQSAWSSDRLQQCLPTEMRIAI